MICSLLRRHGYEVATATTASQALEVLTKAHIHLLLLDVDVPGGREFLGGARLINPTLVVCYMAAAPDEGAGETANDCWLQKPFDIDSFIGIVDEKLRRLEDNTPQ
jgi:DNA-binding response OmpR family regulator